VSSFTPNRAVVVLTPLVFAPVAGAISVWAAQHAGVDIDASSLQAVFIAGAGIAFAKAGLWLKGWQDWEKSDAAKAAIAGPVDEPVETEPDPEVDEAEDFESEDAAETEEFFEEEPVPAGV
jgi:hypothetical protein